jgi:hypothetical protein
MHPSAQWLLVVFVIVVGACTIESSSGPGSGSSAGTGGATTTDINRCKQGCDKMKFFDCASADEQAACYGDCNAATPSQIELFTACAENSICDPACRTKVQPADKAAAGGTGATSSSCATACDKLISCSFLPLGAKDKCTTECSTKGYQYQIDCVTKTACAEIEKKCGGINESGGGSSGSSSGSSGESSSGSSGSSFDVSTCQTQCDSINFFECASTAEHSACRDKCVSATSTARSTFTSCSQSSGTSCAKKKECLDAFLD